MPILKSVNRSKSPLKLLLLFPCPEPNSLLSTSDHTAHINVHNRGSASHLLILTELGKKLLQKPMLLSFLIYKHIYLVIAYFFIPHAQYSAEKLKSDMQMPKTCVTSRGKKKRETKAIWWCQFSLCITLWESF